ncbi:MAG: hypothetical protein J0I84_03530 [Terrimonas sp.]|nr:hypothetical protein [Terrimonas sp.]OJY88241.1 MAG: hypothetical protein BGP13_06825 [Sphingobacteriales bacterium 40-81]
MKRNYAFILLSLLISLFIYLFYRTQRTVVNEIFISLLSAGKYHALKEKISGAIPLNKYIIYSLPEGLWVFCITLTSKFLFIRLGKREIDLVFIPLIFCIGLEFMQLFHFTNGRFDFWDIGVSLLFWSIAKYRVKHVQIRQNILQPYTARSFVCIFSYGIVYLAHVVNN